MNISVSQLTAEPADLLRYVGRRVGDMTVSEDIVQEAYLRLLTFKAKPGNRVSSVLRAHDRSLAIRVLEAEQKRNEEQENHPLE